MKGEILSIDTAKRIADLEKENKELKKKLNCKEVYSTYMPDNLEFVIMTKKDYERNELDYKTRNEEAIELVKSLIIFWNKYSPDNTMEIRQFENILSVLEGVEKSD